ncbi:hypothetical protein RRG08_034035 [Elysia crispata]|uniref:Uncharacterized protein n=1 Tax=Elysia crispata TaxID=231223 RepID=A0AAE0YLD4_9GAST|nr:hypothetical protein RRG08_034035 [Elysia crispata]
MWGSGTCSSTLNSVKRNCKTYNNTNSHVTLTFNPVRDSILRSRVGAPPVPSSGDPDKRCQCPTRFAIPHTLQPVTWWFRQQQSLGGPTSSSTATTTTIASSSPGVTHPSDYKQTCESSLPPAQTEVSGQRAGRW